MEKVINVFVCVFIYSTSYGGWFEKTYFSRKQKLLWNIYKKFLRQDLKTNNSNSGIRLQGVQMMYWSRTWKDGLFRYSASANSDNTRQMGEKNVATGHIHAAFE